jgi:lysozyme-like protein
LRALLVGLLAFALVTQAAAAAMKAPFASTRKSKAAHTTLTLDQQLEHKLAAVRKYRGAIRYYRTHRSLLSSGTRREHAKSNLAYAERRARQLSKTVAALRMRVRTRKVRRLASLPPRKAICAVFADDCGAAIAVAWCESHLRTTAHNGQYLGLFQMGSYERQLFGHGPTAHEQAVAAHRYFVRSGRDWSPWSCRWAAA